MGDAGIMEGYLLAPERRKAGLELSRQCAQAGTVGGNGRWLSAPHDGRVCICARKYALYAAGIGTRDGYAGAARLGHAVVGHPGSPARLGDICRLLRLKPEISAVVTRYPVGLLARDSVRTDCYRD